MEEILLRKDQENKEKHYLWRKVPVDYCIVLGALMAPFRHLFGFQWTWTTLAKPLGNVLLAGDSLHLNESGAAIVTELVVEWLLKVKVQKAIQAASS
jgi:hypothetical protein